jgi:hypothetical protein
MQAFEMDYINGACIISQPGISKQSCYTFKSLKDYNMFILVWQERLAFLSVLSLNIFGKRNQWLSKLMLGFIHSLQTTMLQFIQLQHHCQMI